MKELTHWKKLVNPDYIGAYSLTPGKDLTVTIDSVGRELVTGTGGKKEECTVAKLKGQKPFIINRTNAKTISQVHGSPYIEDWAGKKITLYISTTKVAGEEVECLRVRKQKPELPLIDVGGEKWNDAKLSVESGTTLENIKKYYRLTKNAEKELTAIQNQV
jgi:hypothetical protein